MSNAKYPVKILDASDDLAVMVEAQLLHSLRSDLPQGHNASFVLSAEDPQGIVIGGLVASTSYGWLLTKCLWVAEDRRGEGVGLSLMESAEEKARKFGCHGAWLDTSSPKAMNFYSKLGYTPFGQLANSDAQQPPFHRRWFMSKSLQRA